MSDEAESPITFGCHYSGNFKAVEGHDHYVGGSHRFISALPSQLFMNLMNQLPVSLYGHKVWYKLPFEDLEERKELTNGDNYFNKMCEAAIWIKEIEIYLEADVERTETERDEIERDEPDRDVSDHNEYQFEEEARVEQNVANFVDEEIDLYATPPCSDDEKDDLRGDYFLYKKGSGELKLKQVFDSLKDFKEAMVDYVLKEGWNVKYCCWDKDKSRLCCASEKEEGKEHCKWVIYCAYELPLQKWMVKTFVKDHSCQKSGYSSIITQEVIARLFVNDLRDDPKFMPRLIQHEIQKRWNLTVSIDQCRNARTRAFEIIQEEHDLQFSRLRDYRLELLNSNGDSTVELETYQGVGGRDVFFRFYVCFDALKKTWSSHCRPIFGLDGCFLKCTSKGKLLAAVGRDANNQMFPIAWAVVDVENEDNWVWFLQKLQTDLNLRDGDGFTIISDRAKGLLNAVGALFPKVEHRMCARHIYANLKKHHPHRADMKGLFWKVAKSYNIAQYNKSLEKVKAYDMQVYDSMMQKNPKNCSLAFFSSSSSCDDVSNNISESFNHAIDCARSMPLVEMLETIRRRAMIRIDARKAKAMKHQGKFSIEAQKIVAKEQQKIVNCKIFPAGHEMYEVKDKNSSFKVNMELHTCTCRKWDMSGLPCRHALKIISVKKRKQEDYMSHCYLTSKWRDQYSTPLKAVRGMNFWEKSNEDEIVPPPRDETESSKGKTKIQKRIKGRNESPTKKKTKTKERQASPTKVSRERRIIHCGRCLGIGHNAKKCNGIGATIQRPQKKKKVTDEGPSQPTQSQVID